MTTTFISETLRGYFAVSVETEMRWVASNIQVVGALLPPVAVAIRAAAPTKAQGAGRLAVYATLNSVRLNVPGAGRLTARATKIELVEALATLYGASNFYTAIGKLWSAKSTLQVSGRFTGWVTRPVTVTAVPVLSAACAVGAVDSWVKSLQHISGTSSLIVRPRVHAAASALLQGSSVAATDSGAGRFIPAIATLAGAYSVFYTNLSTYITVAGYPPLFNAVKWTGTSALTAEASALYLFTDPIHSDINKHAGKDVIYQNATGLEKALADVDAYRLTATYAELVRDQWDPYAVSRKNLAHLAWAMGVNLWEDSWDEVFKRQWVAKQWQLKYLRGSRLGLDTFVRAVGGEVKRCIVPPARTYPLAAYTDEERAAYIAKFPQLRMYPYVARVPLKYKCYTPGKSRHKPIPYIVHEIHSSHSYLGSFAVINTTGNFDYLGVDALLKVEAFVPYRLTWDSDQLTWGSDLVFW